MPEIEFQPFYVDETVSWLFSTVLEMFSLVGLNKKRWVLICIKPYLMQIRFPDIQLFSFRLVKTIFYFQNQLFRLSFGFLFRFICVSFQLCLLAASSISFYVHKASLLLHKFHFWSFWQCSVTHVLILTFFQVTNCCVHYFLPFMLCYSFFSHFSPSFPIFLGLSFAVSLSTFSKINLSTLCFLFLLYHW